MEGCFHPAGLDAMAPSALAYDTHLVQVGRAAENFPEKEKHATEACLLI